MLFAAVVIPLIRHPEPTLVFVRRAAHLRRNPGQIAFPGGIVDPGDVDSRAAALREFEEELGVPRERVRIVERLDDVVTLALAVTVTPYLGCVDPPIAYAASVKETAAVHEIPVRAVYAPGALTHGVERGVRHGDRTYDVPSWLFDFEDVHIWGATARMLYGLITRFPTTTTLLEMTSP